MDRGAWRATVHGVTKESDTTEHMRAHTHVRTHTHTRAHTCTPPYHMLKKEVSSHIQNIFPWEGGKLLVGKEIVPSQFLPTHC